MNRGIAEQVELRQRLQIHRIELASLLNESLPGQQRRATKRSPLEHGQQEILGDEVGRSVASSGPYAMVLLPNNRTRPG